MPPLFPPDYPDRPDAPLLSFGPSFSEEIARSVIAAVGHGNEEQTLEADVRIAAALTMLEALHPRDHLECMIAAQGVGLHTAMMDSLARAMDPDISPALAIKFRSNAAQLGRGFSLTVRDLERRQGKPLPERPKAPPLTPAPAPPRDDLPPGPERPGTPPKARPKARSLAAAPVPPRDDPPPNPPAGDTPAGDTATLDDVAELPEDLETRPDGTPGSLAAYAPKAPEEVFVSREPPIMVALATRPKEWLMVNAPADQQEAGKIQSGDAGAGEVPAEEPARPVMLGVPDRHERIFTGDALARFASARFDPDAPVEKLCFDDEDSVVELELISTGGDPEAEAERAAMIAAHPEGKPSVTFRYGNKKPPDDVPDG